MTTEMTSLGVSMPNRSAGLEKIPEYARRGEEAGLDSVWGYELYRNPFAMLCTCVPKTERVTLGTATTAFSRSPFEAANAAADVNELSGGRMLLGLGAGTSEFLEAFHSTDSKAAMTRMREYITCLRLSWEYLSSGEAETFEGRHYRMEPPEINPWGLRAMARPTIPIWLCAHGPKMVELAGEVEDGYMATLTTPRWIEERVLPRLEAGARRAGRDLSDLQMAQMVVCSVHPDRELAYRRARTHIGFYCLHPLMNPLVELHGLEAERDAIRQVVMARGLEALATETPDALVNAFSIAGTPEEGRQKLAGWQAATPNIIFHTPYVPPLTEAESEDTYVNTLEAFGTAARVASPWSDALKPASP